SQCQEHPWAQRSTYEQLYTQAVERSPASQHTLDFVSPTVFRSQGRNQLMPVPRLIFASPGKAGMLLPPCPCRPRCCQCWVQRLMCCVMSSKPRCTILVTIVRSDS